MVFYYIEGCRREIGENNKVNIVVYYKYIEDLVVIVDSDGLLIVYKLFIGKVLDGSREVGVVKS